MLKIKVNSKINLFLEITGKLSNGYHTVDTVMQSVSLSDFLELELVPKKDGIKLSCDVPMIPLDERNIAYKTAKAFLEAAGADCGVSIGIRKSIPSEAGMGGGSADGAAVLVGLNMLCGNPLVVSDLEQIAAKLGADIPFCIEGGTKRLLGIGTERAEQYTTRHLHLVIAKPQGGISTPEAYRLLDTIYGDFADHKPMSPEGLIDYICGKPGRCSDVLFNRFESVLDQLCPASKDLIDYMRDHSHGSLLCGSGAAVFAVADSPSNAKALADKVKNKYPDCSVWIAETAPSGCIIL